MPYKSEIMAEREPLEAEIWFPAFERLSQRLESAAEDDIRACVRQTYHLLQLAPLPFHPAFPLTMTEEDFEALLGQSEAGAANALVESVLRWRLPIQDPSIASLAKFGFGPDSACNEVVDLSSARSVLLGLCHLILSVTPAEQNASAAQSMGR